MFHRDSFKPSDLILVKQAHGSSLLLLGAFVRLNSGGPLGIVEALDSGDNATVKWIGLQSKSSLPDVCFTCVSNASAVRPTTGAAQRS